MKIRSDEDHYDRKHEESEMDLVPKKLQMSKKRTAAPTKKNIDFTDLFCMHVVSERVRQDPREMEDNESDPKDSGSKDSDPNDSAPKHSGFKDFEMNDQAKIETIEEKESEYSNEEYNFIDEDINEEA